MILRYDIQYDIQFDRKLASFRIILMLMLMLMFEADIHTFLQFLILILTFIEIKPIQPSIENTVRNTASTTIKKISYPVNRIRNVILYLQLLCESFGKVVTIKLQQVVFITSLNQ